MRRTLTICWPAARCSWPSPAPLVAHHAFGGEFDPNKPVLLKGKIIKLEWVNPHAWIHIEMVKPDGPKACEFTPNAKCEEWMVEGGTPNTLLRRGITQRLADDRHRDRRGRLSGARPFAESRQRPQRHVSRTAASCSWDRRAPARRPTAPIRPRAADGARDDRNAECGLVRNGLDFGSESASFRYPKIRSSARRRRRRTTAPATRVRPACNPDRSHSTFVRPRHLPPHREREHDRQRQAGHLHRERRAVVALGRLGDEQPEAGHEHHDQAADEPRRRVARHLRHRLLAQPEAEQPQIDDQHRAADHREREQVDRLDDGERPRGRADRGPERTSPRSS